MVSQTTAHGQTRENTCFFCDGQIIAAEQAAALAARDFAFSADGECVRAAGVWREDAKRKSSTDGADFTDEKAALARIDGKSLYKLPATR